MPSPQRCGPAAIWCSTRGVLPRALREHSAAQIRAFEETFEPLGLTALAIAFVVVGALIRLGGLS